MTAERDAPEEGTDNEKRCGFCHQRLTEFDLHMDEPWRLHPHNCEVYELRAVVGELLAHDNPNDVGPVWLELLWARARHLREGAK